MNVVIQARSRSASRRRPDPTASGQSFGPSSRTFSTDSSAPRRSFSQSSCRSATSRTRQANAWLRLRATPASTSVRAPGAPSSGARHGRRGERGEPYGLVAAAGSPGHLAPEPMLGFIYSASAGRACPRGTPRCGMPVRRRRRRPTHCREFWLRQRSHHELILVAVRFDGGGADEPVGGKPAGEPALELIRRGGP